jgi:hypothetical protein
LRRMLADSFYAATAGDLARPAQGGDQLAGRHAFSCRNRKRARRFKDGEGPDLALPSSGFPS